MPGEWFKFPSDEDIKNNTKTSIAVLFCNRLMDTHEFGKAKEFMEKLLAMEDEIIGIYSHILKNDIIYCELLGEKREDVLSKLSDQKQMRFMKLMKNNPSVLRTQYAYALIAQKNPYKARDIKGKFKKCSLTYPYASEIESERELIGLVENLY